MNFSQRMGDFVLDKIILNLDMMASRDQIKANMEEGLIYKEKLKKMKGFTAGQIFKVKCKIGKDINDFYKENTVAARKEHIKMTRKDKEV